MSIKIRITISWDKNSKELIFDLGDRLNKALTDSFMQTSETGATLEPTRLSQTYHLRQKHNLKKASDVKID